jgi:hypothetical protein
MSHLTPPCTPYFHGSEHNRHTCVTDKDIEAAEDDESIGQNMIYAISKPGKRWLRDSRPKVTNVVLPGTPYYRQCLKKLVRSFEEKISLTNDPILVDIEEAIKYCRLLLDSIPPGGSFSSNEAISLAELLKLAFDRTQNIEQLDESIGLLTDILEVPAGQAFCNYIVGTLTLSSFECRKVLLHCQHDSVCKPWNRE